MTIALPMLVLLLCLLAGVPIAVALAGSGMFGIWLITGDLAKVMNIVGLVPFSTVADYSLTTIPMFILMAYFSASSGLARDLYNAAAAWLSHIKGGLAIATVFACGIFGAMSGASTAAASVMSRIAMPEMRRHGYSDELGAGSIGVGSTLDILIPPSIAMVIYGVATQTSIGKLLVAGVVPGALVAVLLAIMIYVWVRISPHHAPAAFHTPREERIASLKRVWPSLLLIFLVLLMLYSGVATPTEIGALGALLAAVIGAVFGRLTLPEGIEALKQTIRTSAMIFLILIGATIFGYYMTLSRIPQEVVSLVGAMDLNRWVVIIGIVVAYFIISMFMDEIPLLLLTLQLTFPLITSLGFDPIWFGVLSMMMVAMGLVFPPVGLLAFVVSATANVDLMKVYKGCTVLMLALVATTVLLMIFPDIALWLPRTMR
ncbi:MAG: TRAP transporter large permease [Xanthobacteraceae bacterium]|nr:TRAP transporter large permease [Xanthobacteraceae bacterium]